jgi:hypothetical protein
MKLETGFPTIRFAKTRFSRAPFSATVALLTPMLARSCHRPLWSEGLTVMAVANARLMQLPLCVLIQYIKASLYSPPQAFLHGVYSKPTSTPSSHTGSLIEGACAP